MKNIPIITLIPRVWLLAVFAAITNFAALNNYQIIAPHWEHKVNEVWNGINGVWTQTYEEAWIQVPAKSLFDIFGAMIYMPGAVSMAFLLYVVVIHLFYRETIDNDTFTGRYLTWWEAASPEQKLILTTATRIGIFLGVAIIIAAIAK